MSRPMMQIIPATLAITNFEELCERVYQNHEPCVISRLNQHDVIMMSVEDFNGWQETLLQDERRWDSAFANSQDILARLSEEALIEYHAGKTELLDPDTL